MAAERDLGRLVRRLGYSPAQLRQLIDTLYESKVSVYQQTLATLGGAQNNAGLAPAVVNALRDEATVHGKRIAATLARELATEAQRLNARGVPLSEIESSLLPWLDNYITSRAGMISLTETYGPHADATIAFYRDAGVDPDKPLFDFGGRPAEGDQPPECPICVALVESGPWSLRQMILIGVPHPQCRQNWHYRGERDDLPAHLELGDQVAGIIGARTLIERAGGRAQAVEAITSGQLPE